MPHRLHPALMVSALAGSLVLAGCSQDAQFAPVCPQLALLADGADLTRFTGNGRDVTDRVLEARVLGVEASCKPGRRGEVVATLKVQSEFTRGPAAPGRVAVVPYFVAVLAGGDVVDRKEFILEGNFATNVDQIRVAGSEVELRFPVTAERSAAYYKIYVSLLLTPEELAFNRRPTR